MKHKNMIRINFREAVFKRDRYNCKFCGAPDFLDAHHITDRNEMPNGGYVKENGITVCPKCHYECEQFHKSNGKTWADGKHPDDLYRMIGSNKTKAIVAAERLNKHKT